MGNNANAPKIGGGIGGAMPYVGAAFNVLNGVGAFGKKDYYDAMPNQQNALAKEQMSKALDYNLSPQLAGLKENRARMLNALSNMPGNRGGTVNRLAALQNNYDSSLQGLYEQDARHRASVRMSAAGMLNQMGEQDRAENRYAQDNILRTDAVQSGIIGTGLTQAAENYQHQQGQNMTMDMLYQLYGSYNPMLQMLLKAGYNNKNQGGSASTI
jgi:hypothetical protein